MDLAAPDCVNCGASLEEGEVSGQKRFARCSYCLTLHNVKGYFDSDSKERVRLVELSELEEARGALSRVWLGPIMVAVPTLILVGGLLYFPIILLIMFNMASGNSRLPEILGFIAAATLVPLVLVALLGWRVGAFSDKHREHSRREGRKERIAMEKRRIERELELRKKLVAEVNCPKCGISLMPQSIDIATKRAKCSYCAHGFDAAPMLALPTDPEQERRVKELRELEAKLDWRTINVARVSGVLATLAMASGNVGIVALGAFKSRDPNLFLQFGAALLLLGTISCGTLTYQLFRTKRINPLA